MTDAIRQITISEVVLIFLLLFLIPLLALLVRRLRKYEAAFGVLEDAGKAAGKDAPKPEPGAPAPAAAAPAPPAPAGAADNVFPYKMKTFLSPSDRACLSAMQEALGEDVNVFPKVALWELFDPTDRNPGYAARLHDKDYDFLVCDSRTGQPLTAVMYTPGKGRPAGKIDDIKKICKAAGAPVVFIDQATEYDADSLKKALGLPDLDA